MLDFFCKDETRERLSRGSATGTARDWRYRSARNRRSSRILKGRRVVNPMRSSKTPTILELFAAFAAQLPLLTQDDLASTVEAMRASTGFRRMMVHAREQADAIGLPVELLDRPVEPAVKAAS
jgi:hypothetical protein